MSTARLLTIAATMAVVLLAVSVPARAGCGAQGNGYGLDLRWDRDGAPRVVHNLP